jgi:eukaryotic-like serine/threonine-protein kinase
MGGRYETLFQLARGGMATVYVGTVRGAFGFRQLVAIKRPHDHLLSDPDYKRDLLTEARLASLIHHANVVDVRDVESVDQHVSLVMDYVEGASLGELIHNGVSGGPRVTPAIAVRIILDACAGLHAAHELVDERGRAVQLVHRDISPQNLLVGLDGTTRVADFGVAKVERKGGGTTDGHLKGKLAYMAPEYLRGQPIDRRFDVFGMGIVLWEGLTGKRLFRGEHEADTMRRVLDHSAPLVSSIVPELGTALDAVVETALAKPVEHRFQNAAAMASALEASARDAGIVASHREVAELVRASVGAKLEERRALIRQHMANESSVLSSEGDRAVDTRLPDTVAATTAPAATIPEAAATLASPQAPAAGTLRSADAVVLPASAVSSFEPTRTSAAPQTVMPVSSTQRDVGMPATLAMPVAMPVEPTADLPMSLPTSSAGALPVSSSPLRWLVPLGLVVLVGGGAAAVLRSQASHAPTGAAVSADAPVLPASATSVPAAAPSADPAPPVLAAPSAAVSARPAASSAATPASHGTTKPRTAPTHKPAPSTTNKASTDPPPNPYAN